MTLQELLEIQKELNSHCDGSPTYEQLEWAIAAELGEFAQARKGDWCWWKRNGKGFESESRDRQLDELADILCFLLTGLLMDNALIGLDLDCDFWQYGSVFRSKPRAVLRHCELGKYDRAIDHFAGFIKENGFTKEEVETAYLKKVEVNKARWEAVTNG